MEIEARCKCGHSVTVSDPFEGMVVLCPGCGNAMAVPRPPWDPIPARPASAAGRTRRRPRSSPTRGFVLALVSGLLLLAAGAACQFGVFSGKGPEIPDRRALGRSSGVAPAAPAPAGAPGTGPASAPDPPPPDPAPAPEVVGPPVADPLPPTAEPPSAPASAKARVLASKKGAKYHRPDCEWAQKISDTNRVEYDSSADAEKADLKPCNVCRPERE